MEFQIGQKVEIIGKEEGFEGSYYAAKVLSKEGTNQYKVEYGTLLKEDESGPLQEVIDADQLRPQPPDVPNDAFSLEEVVDVYDNDGWWVGLIEGKFGSEYFVSMFATKEEMPFPLDKLRVHLDWCDGKWEPCEAYKKRIKNTSKHRGGGGDGGGRGSSRGH